ncbi:uncharacterized protein LOC133175277 [Saccostrea echinata]|uniref:uncharacterized protein LOC133175277 n=1 Tax=Saccostrea echinata TaxID=191078 RepID=UPI002A83DB3B|nr:uncharacterized protein LOC133175277 [Saccostrea echinata]
MTTSFLCPYNQYPHPKSNNCTECPHGSFGLNCKLKCPSGYYGALCMSVCECPVSDCHYVRGCTTENSTHISSITPDITNQPSTVYEWTNEKTDFQIRITSSQILAKQNRVRYVNHHDGTWIAVSCSLIGSLATLFLIGCLMYFCSRQKLKMKFPKRIRRILFSYIEPGVFILLFNLNYRNMQLIQEGHLEQSTSFPTYLSQDDDPYTEIRFSQIGGACSATCTNTICTNEKDHEISKESTHVSRNTNIYEKCSFEPEYDHVNLKVKSNTPELLHGKWEVVYAKDQEYVSLSDKGRSLKEFPNDDGSSKSLTLPSNWKRVKENYKSQPHSYSLCYVESKNESKDEQITNDEEDNYVELISDNLMTTKGPKYKEEGRPYSLAHVLSYNDLNSDDGVKSGDEVFSIASPEVKEDVESENPGSLKKRPYSYVKNLVE